MALIGRVVVPARCDGVVLIHAFALGTHEAEIKLSLGVALFGRAAVPEHGVRVVLFRSFSLGAPGTEVVLREGRSLIGRLRHPQDCLCVILLHTSAVANHITEGELSVGKSFVGSTPPQLHHLVDLTFQRRRRCDPWDILTTNFLLQFKKPVHGFLVNLLENCLRLQVGEDCGLLGTFITGEV